MRMLHFEELHTAGSFTSPDIEIRCKTGERKWIVTRPVEILLRGQVGYLAFIYDITERKRAEEALHASEKRALALVGELKKADENKNQFISVLSHELRNPLAAILAGIQVLELTQDIGHAREVKEIINRQTKQLCKLVDDLLELTRISQNKIKLKKENINLNEIVKSAAGDIRFEYEKKGVKLEIKIREKPVKLNADPVRVTQAIGNILFNALKFTNASGTVRITLTEEKNDAVISVKDDGIGISQEILAHLFTPFTQADTSLDRKGGGLGLGLSIVKGIVDLHEGSVSAFSEGLGKGSTFTIHLPITPEDDSKAEKLAGGDKSEKRLKLLIIEDNRDFADLLSAMLSMIGHHVDIAYDGIEGVNLAKQIKPDVILCDIGLPGMNGYDVAKSVRNDDGIKDTHLIALTGYAGEDEAERILKAGFDKHLAKPVDFTTLKSLL
jgi:signal transduction histidine kinase/CheY-like chemotaxis protein